MRQASRVLTDGGPANVPTSQLMKFARNAKTVNDPNDFNEYKNGVFGETRKQAASRDGRPAGQLVTRVANATSTRNPPEFSPKASPSHGHNSGGVKIGTNLRHKGVPPSKVVSTRRLITSPNPSDAIKTDSDPVIHNGGGGLVAAYPTRTIKRIVHGGNEKLLTRHRVRKNRRRVRKNRRRFVTTRIGCRVPTGFIARNAQRHGPGDGEPRRHRNSEQFYLLFVDEMLSNGEIRSDEKSSGVQTGNNERTRAAEKVFDGRERRIRREYGEHERERSERSASDRGGGRTANMAASAPVPGLSETNFAFSG